MFKGSNFGCFCIVLLNKSWQYFLISWQIQCKKDAIRSTWITAHTHVLMTIHIFHFFLFKNTKNGLHHREQDLCSSSICRDSCGAEMPSPLALMKRVTRRGALDVFCLHVAVPCAISTISAEFASVLAGLCSHFLAAKLLAMAHFIPVCHFMALFPACLSASLPSFLEFLFFFM